MIESIYIVEFEWQVQSAISAVKTGQGVAIAANPMSYYALEQAGVKTAAISDFYEMSEFWSLYEQSLEKVDRLVADLDSALIETDSRFAFEDLRPFKYLGYPLKINLDQIICYLFQLRQILKKYNASNFVVALGSKLTFDDMGLFSPKNSIIGNILEKVQVQEALGIKVIFQTPPIPHVETVIAEGIFSFGQPRIDQIIRKSQTFLYLLKRHIGSIFIQFGISRKTNQILSINCKEIEAMAPELVKQEINISALLDVGVPLNSGLPYVSVKDLLDGLFRGTDLSNIKYEGLSLRPFIESMVPVLSRSLERMLKAYQKYNKILGRGRISLLAVQTLSHFNISSVMANEAAHKNGIKTICWMHGGYGAYYSVPGYDVTDFRFTNNHVVFGTAVRDILNSERSPLRNHNKNPELDICVGGTPYFKGKYNGYQRPNRERKTVLLTIGGVFGYNQFYFGYNRPKAEFWNWQAHRRIIETLSYYSDQYRIIIKDYATSEMRSTWDNLVADLGGGMEVITTEQSYEETVMAADVLIYSWVSTSFIEGLYTDADILLFDDSDLSDQAVKLFKETIVFEQKLDWFIDKMTTYLEKGTFYSQNHEAVKSYFCPVIPADDVVSFFKRLMKP